MSTAALQFEPHRAGRTSPAPVRLTRRGRLLVLAVLVALALASYAWWGSAPAVSTEETHHAAAQTVVVEPGQTLWDIALEIAPGHDPRGVIDEIVDLNALPDAGSVRVGQPLYVPEY
jgi:hypothetical protein